MKALALALFAALPLGCMARERHFEETPLSSRLVHGRQVRDSSRTYALIVPRMDHLELRVREIGLCRGATVTRARREEVVEVRADQARWWGVAGLVLAGGAVIAMADTNRARADGVALIAAGGAVAGVPLLLERTERSPAPDRETWTSGEPVECDEHARSSTRVMVRVRGQLLDAVSDAAGRVRFPDVAPTSEVVVYVDDWAVPVVIGAPPTGTLPPGASPASPASPETH